MPAPVAPPNIALQQRTLPGPAPRPLPVFLEMIRAVAHDDQLLARAALRGLGRYEEERRPPPQPEHPSIAAAGSACLRDLGGSGSPVVLVPSLINPPHVLDLPGQSLAEAMSVRHHVMLVDWGPAAARLEFDLADHVEAMLVPLLQAVGSDASLVGYCLGGTMAIAAANLAAIARLATLATPWHFSAYPDEARTALAKLWDGAGATTQMLGVLPTEVLQLAFWSLDPRAMVRKFAAIADEAAGSETIKRFVALEDWANDGEPLPVASARELIEQFFLEDVTGRGKWVVGGSPARAAPVRALHFTASNDRIVPAATAPPGPAHAVASGHVGMVVGRSAPERLYRPLLDFLDE